MHLLVVRGKRTDRVQCEAHCVHDLKTMQGIPEMEFEKKWILNKEQN